MFIVSSIIWVLLLIWLLSLLIPSETMRRDPSGNAIYYAFWLLLLGMALFLQYQVLASLHHRTLALVTDAIGVLLFIGLQYLRCRRYHVKGAGNGRIHNRRMHHSWRADLSGLCLDPPRTLVEPEEDERRR